MGGIGWKALGINVRTVIAQQLSQSYFPVNLFATKKTFSGKLFFVEILLGTTSFPHFPGRTNLYNTFFTSLCPVEEKQGCPINSWSLGLKTGWSFIMRTTWDGGTDLYKSCEEDHDWVWVHCWTGLFRVQGTADQWMFEDDNMLGFRKANHIFPLFQDIQMW